MREDMFKVIVERPRYKNWHMDKVNHKHKQCDYNDYEDAPSYASMTPKCKLDSKELNENLNPLKRFLKKAVGRDWDDIYSEVSVNLNKNSAVQLHVFQHLTDFIFTNNKIINDKVVLSKYECYLDDFWLSDFFYVDPKTNKLFHHKKKKRVVEKIEIDKIDENIFLKKKGDVWYTLYMKDDGTFPEYMFEDKEKIKKVNREYQIKTYDVFEEDHIINLDLKSLYGVGKYCYKKEKTPRKVLIKKFGFKKEFKELRK